MYHHKTRQWDHKMKDLFDEIDDYLEDRYGKEFPLHPNRPARGETANKAADGLFNVGVSYSAGYGSRLGKGYVIDIHMSTLASVPDEKEESIREEVVELVREKLPVYFPNRDLSVDRDGTLFKIHGDLSMGNL